MVPPPAADERAVPRDDGGFAPGVRAAGLGCTGSPDDGGALPWGPPGGAGAVPGTPGRASRDGHGRLCSHAVRLPAWSPSPPPGHSPGPAAVTHAGAALKSLLLASAQCQLLTWHLVYGPCQRVQEARCLKALLR